MPRETAIKRLKRELEAYKGGARQLTALLTATRAERDRARDRAADFDVYRSRVETLAIKVARLQGYIDRVREVDGTATAPVDFLEERPTMGQERRQPITAQDILAMSDDEFSALVDNSQAKNRLDTLMGRDSDG